MDIVDDYQFESEKMSIKTEKHQDKIVLQFLGIMDFKYPNIILSTLIEKIHDYLIENKIKLVELNIYNLSFMNSHGIKLFIDWIRLNETLSEDIKYQKYKLKFVTNPNISWQESSLEILKTVAPDNIEIL